MSGRKSSEVANVLRQGESVRKMTDGIYSNQIETDVANWHRNTSAIKELQQQNQNAIVNLNNETEKMFGDKAARQKQDFNELKTSLMNLEVSGDTGANVQQQLNNLDRQLQNADAEAESIRRSIRNKDWYCDDEYRRAQILVGTYKNLRDQRINLQHRMAQVSQSSQQQLNQAKSIVNQLQMIQKQINSMNEIAQKRQQSDEMRKDLQQLIKTVPSNWAEKFFANEYSQLNRTVQSAISDSDDNLINNFKNVYSSVTVFKTKLDKRIEEWQKQKADTENLLKNVESLADFSSIVRCGNSDLYRLGSKCRFSPFVLTII